MSHDKLLALHTDWLNQSSVYFDSSRIPLQEPEIVTRGLSRVSREGLWLYSKFGYSVFGMSWLSGINYLLPNQQLIKRPNSGWKLEQKQDPFYSPTQLRAEKEIPWGIRDRLNEMLLSTTEDIILPLSSGYDSRLLLWALRDIPRERIFCYTYGTSFPQASSREAVVAKELAEREGVRWNLIPLGNHKYLEPSWVDKFGFHTHLHGTHAMQFYQRISELHEASESVVISGLVGDLFAGKISVKKIEKPQHLMRLAYSHGVSLRDKDLTSPQSSLNFLAQYFEEREQYWHDPKFRMVELGRAKMRLLNYLIRVPESFGFRVETPFTWQDTAVSMMSLPSERRRGRVWQSEFFAQEGLNVRAKGRTTLSLDFQNLMIDQRSNFRLENVSHLFSSATLRDVQGLSPSVFEAVFLLSSVGGSKKSAAANKWGFASPTTRKYCASQIISPISWYQSKISEKLTFE